MVAHLNRLEESQLELFLFGADRTPTAKIRAGLWDIQGRRCFYCNTRIAEPTGGDVDHFVPWSRYPDDTLDNFVVADKSCNGLKSSSLAAADHLTRWTRRFADGFEPACPTLLNSLTGQRGTDNPTVVSTSLVRST